MSVPRWLGMLLWRIGIVFPALRCSECGREIPVDGRTREEVEANMAAHDWYWHGGE